MTKPSSFLSLLCYMCFILKGKSSTFKEFQLMRRQLSMEGNQTVLALVNAHRMPLNNNSVPSQTAHQGCIIEEQLSIRSKVTSVHSMVATQFYQYNRSLIPTTWTKLLGSNLGSNPSFLYIIHFLPLTFVTFLKLPSIPQIQKTLLQLVG